MVESCGSWGGELGLLGPERAISLEYIGTAFE
jgi:hypothetical protein